MQFAEFWYIVALSEQLRPNTVLARSLLGKWLAIFRGEDGQAVALRVDAELLVVRHRFIH